MFAALALAAAVACSRDTVPQPRTLFSGVFSALHVDEGAGSDPIKGKPHDAMELRLSAAACRWPRYTVAFVGRTHLFAVKTGERVAPGDLSGRYSVVGFGFGKFR